MKYETLKKMIDFFLSIILLVLLIPFLLLISVIISIELKKFPFIIQQRGLTLNKYSFKLYKLRTMREDAELISDEEKIKDIFTKPSLLKYVPPFCSWLRRTGLDELPQLINILKGEMSFIGPRPLNISDLNLMKQKYSNFYNDREKLNVKPGLSGLWQIFGNRDKGIKNLIELDKLYEKKLTLKLDLKLIYETFYVMIFAKNQDAIINYSIDKVHKIEDLFDKKIIYSRKLGKSPLFTSAKLYKL